MKHLQRLAPMTLLAVLTIFVMWGSGGIQGIEKQSIEKPDTRIWNQAYWMEMARRGLAEVAPDVPVQEAIFRSSWIDAPGFLFTDSPDVPVTTATDTTQSENSIFVNPLNNNKVLNSNNSTEWPVNSFYGANAFFTTDGGDTWNGSVQGAGGSNSGDPAAVIGLDGTYYVGFVTSSYDQGIAYSTNEGATWTAVQVAGGGYLLDKSHLWIDNSPASPYEGNLYSAWTNFQFGANDGEIEIARSTNGGLNWGSRINISSAVGAGSHNQGVNIQTGPNGEVYAVWAIYDSWPSDETAIGFAKSTNGGASFSPATRIITNIRGIRDTRTSKNQRVNSFPVMAVDISTGPNSGTIYVVWSNIGIPGINVGPDIDVYMIKSTNGGSSWSTPLKVNQDPSGLGKEHYFPWMNCDPETGDLYVIFYDDRNVSSTHCEVFVAASEDGGATWTDFQVSDVSFTPAPIPGLAADYFGDYIGISARGGRVYPAWTDNRDGRAMTYVSPFDASQSPVLDIKIDGSDNPPSVPKTQPVHVTVSLNPGDQHLVPHDWWLSAEHVGGGTWWYSHAQRRWIKSATPIRATGAPLVYLNDVSIYNGRLAVGTFIFTFAIDDLNNSYEGTYIDTVSIDVY